MTPTSRTLRKAAIRLPLAALALVVATGCTASTAGAGAGGHRTPVSAHGVASSEWTTYDQNGLRTGVDASGATFNNPTTAWTSPVLDGSLYGQPLIYANRVFAATENDTVYGLAADTGAVLWSKHLATPFNPNTVPEMCGDIDPTVGITGTPVIDTARSEIFVVATEQVPGGASHHLVGLNLYTGAVVLDEDIDPAAVVAPAFELQRVSLGLTDGRVIIGMGGNAGDCGIYHGLVISAPEDGSAPSTFTVADLPQRQPGRRVDGWCGTGHRRPGQRLGRLGQRRHRVDAGRLGQRAQAEPDDDRCSTASRPAPGSPTTTATRTWPPPPRSCCPTAWCSRSASCAPPTSCSQSHLGGIGGQLNETANFCTGNDPDGGAAQVNGTVYVPCGSGLTAVTPTSTNSAPTWTSTTGAHSSPIVAGGKIWSFGGGTLYELNTDGTPVQELRRRQPDHALPVAGCRGRPGGGPVIEPAARLRR